MAYDVTDYEVSLNNQSSACFIPNGSYIASGQGDDVSVDYSQQYTEDSVQAVRTTSEIGRKGCFITLGDVSEVPIRSYNPALIQPFYKLDKLRCYALINSKNTSGLCSGALSDFGSLGSWHILRLMSMCYYDQEQFLTVSGRGLIL